MSYYENGQPEWIAEFHSSSDTTTKVITGYYSDGTMKCVRNLKNGIEHGEQIVYFPNGKVETLCVKDNGIQSGISKAFFKNGKLFAQGNYASGLRDGSWEIWKTNGDKFIRNYVRDTLHGQTKEIRTNGSIVFGQYDKGNEIGEWITKSADSLITMITTYENGVLQGSVKEFYPTGELYVNGYFLNGKKHGEWLVYNKSGVIDTIEVYLNDKFIEYKFK